MEAIRRPIGIKIPVTPLGGEGCLSSRIPHDQIPHDRIPHGWVPHGWVPHGLVPHRWMAHVIPHRWMAHIIREHKAHIATRELALLRMAGFA